MERRVLLAISLSFLVLFLYQTFFAPASPPRSAGNLTPPASTIGPGTGLPPVGNVSPEAPPPPSAATVSAVLGETAEREITVDTRKVRAVFSNRGARLRHWYLKDYSNGRGEPLDLIPENIPSGMPYPFSLRVDDAATTAKLNDAFYVASTGTAAAVDATDAKATLTFDVELADGLRARKEFVFEPDAYIVTFTANVTQAGQALNPTIDWGPGLGDEIARTPPGSFFSPNYIYLAQGIHYADGDVERLPATSLGQGMARDGVFEWAGVDDHYFISAVIKPPSPLHIEYVPVVIPPSEAGTRAGTYAAYAVRFPSPPAGVRFFFGPKQLDVLRAVDPQFTKAIYFGVFAVLAAPLLEGLRWVNNYVDNWGWSIIVLTILINLAMFPLRHKSAVSMRKMQELQPQMKAIQERYAKYKVTDPERQKMNQEVMELYKARGVNPASGCVPMLLMIPFLFAFYAMLGQAIELRGAKYGWIPDLAQADPLFITPILMGITMFWQQKMTPTTADPTQQKVMMIMPFMFTGMMLFAPSGLVIYWTVSNMWTIGQQYFTNYLIGQPKVHNVRPSAAERRVKEK